MNKQLRETATAVEAFATTAPMHWTASAYLTMAQPDDGNLCEVLDGELIMSPASILRHQDIAGNIYVLLKAFVRSQKLGKVFPAPVDVVLGDDLVEPDVLFVSNDRKAILTRERIVGAPDLVVEALSLSTSQRDLRYKWDLYARSGVLEYWVVNPDMETVEVLMLVDGLFQRYALAEKDKPVVSKVLDGFSATTADVFAE